MKFIRFKILETLILGLGVWFFVSPLAGFQEAMFLVILLLVTNLVSAFLQGRDGGFVMGQDELEKYYYGGLRHSTSVFSVGGVVWYLNYSQTSMADLFSSVAIGSIMSIVLAEFLEKRRRKKQLRDDNTDP